MTTITATYSPEDNKLRLTASTRLDRELYERVRAAGFIWAAKQGTFVAPMWTPERADLCIELAGEIEDEDSTLEQRAEQRAERFDGYQDNRRRDYQSARDGVARIADNIPLGQPILVGHHSQRHAERDAKRIENGMRKAVQMWDTADYWKRRAAGALANASYKELPAVRHRRIKGLEADARKVRKNIEAAEQNARIWAKVPRYEWDRQTAIALYIAGRASGSFGASLYSPLKDGRMHGDTAWRIAVAAAERYATGSALRWLQHYENRIAYERAMLGEGGGLAADKFTIEVGGSIKAHGEWLGVVRVNRKDGAIVSVTAAGRHGGVYGIERIQDYKAPDPEKAEAVKAALKAPPICNYPGEGFRHMTRAEWADVNSDYKGTVTVGDDVKTNRYGNALSEAERAPFVGTQRHRVRQVIKAGSLVYVYLTDEKTKEPPKVGAVAKPVRSIKPKADRDEGERLAAEPAAPKLSPESFPAIGRDEPRPVYTPREVTPAESEVEAMRKGLRAGTAVVAVSAPQLFPTPPALAARMVDEAALCDGDRILEPSAGTGRILDAIAADGSTGHVVAVEVVRALASDLDRRYGISAPANPGHSGEVICADFVGAPLAIGRFDRVIMNPPFADGQDVAHVTRALDYLAPGGRLVSILSSGVLFRSDRRTREFRELIERMGGVFEELPADTFASSGTGVNTVLLVVDAPEGNGGGKRAPEAAATAPTVAPAGPTTAAALRDSLALNGRAYAAALGADPVKVGHIVSRCMGRRVEWSEPDRLPLAVDVLREADGLAAIASAPDIGDLGPAYRAASLHLLDLADEARARELAAA